jgi:hypothetical protein
MARVRRPIQEIERNLLYDMYRRNGGLWDVVLNDVRREVRFQHLPENVRELFQDAGQRNAARRRVRNFIGTEQRGY